jgi:hypothetical protein
MGLRFGLVTTGRIRFGGVCAAVAFLAACTSSGVKEPPVDPDVVRADISKRLPTAVKNRDGWAIDIFAAFEALSIKPTPQNICAVIAVTEQESTFQVNPPVPALPEIARHEIDARAASYNIPKMVVTAALGIRSSNGATYTERLKNVKTEQELSDIFEDFIGMVPLGERLFGSFNPVRTGGPMQVSIAFAEEHAKQKRYPYPMPGSVRTEIFTRRGGMYFGIAHLLDYPASYPEMRFRFADFNAGHYASRNAAFQNAVSKVSRKPLAFDGDLIIHGSSEPSRTELAIRSIAARLELDDQDIRRDLELGREPEFEKTKLYERVFALAGSVPRAMIPNIRLKSPKIKRKLTTEWFATRVDGRYKRCLTRDNPST